MHDGAGNVVPGFGRGRVRTALIILSMASLAWAIVARVTGPTDLWEQTQRRTISYTTDIIVHGNWILPRERDVRAATKPPLYNWLAVPAVRVMGFSSELAHKLPSVVALALCWLLVVRLGQRLEPGGALGWLAGTAFAANYVIFKLGYLARPDMLLTLWCAIGWALATSILIEPESDDGRPAARRWLRPLGFWTCVALAGLTKGPVSLVLVVYPLMAARPLGGSWRSLRRLGWWWGLPLGLGVPALWVVGAWSIDAAHVREQLWQREIWGRITGTETDDGSGEPASWLRTFPYMPAYFVVRFAPWSVLSLATMIELVRRRGRDRRRVWQQSGETGRWLAGASGFLIVVVGVFSLSAGKRADYLAPAIPAASLLAAWWLVKLAPWRLAGAAWPAGLLATVTLAGLTVFNVRQPQAPAPGFSRGIERFVAEAAVAIDARPREPVLFIWTDVLHVQALLGSSQPDGMDQVLPRLDRGESFLAVVGGRADQPRRFEELTLAARPDAHVEVLVESAVNPKSDRWSEQMRLYFVRSGRAAAGTTGGGRGAGGG